MSNTIRVSDETFRLFTQVRDILDVGSDTIVRHSLEALFPGILDRGDVQGDEETILSCYGEFLSEKMTGRDEWQGVRRGKK